MRTTFDKRRIGNPSGMHRRDSLRLELVENPAVSEDARLLITEYVLWVSALAKDRYGLQFDADSMIASDLGASSPFRSPDGRLYLVLLDGRAVGVGGVRITGEGEAELLRMYVVEDVRGLGAGRLLLTRLVSDAREMGACSIRLESLKTLEAAHALYHSAGFVDIEPYSGHGMGEFQPEGNAARFRDSVVFMELRVCQPFSNKRINLTRSPLG